MLLYSAHITPRLLYIVEFISKELFDEAIRVTALDRSRIEGELADVKASLPGLTDAAERGGEGEKSRLRSAERVFAIAAAKLEAIARLPHP